MRNARVETGGNSHNGEKMNTKLIGIVLLVLVPIVTEVIVKISNKERIAIYPALLLACIAAIAFG